MNNWTKKQKNTFARIMTVGVCFVLLFILEHTGICETLPRMAEFFMYFIPYLIIGYDVILKAGRNISHGQVFDENFLMMIATFAAFWLGYEGTGEYLEALAVMLFYQVGELFESIAVGRSRASIAEMMAIAPEYANLAADDGSISETDPEDVHVDDIIVVRPGEKVPLDGMVIEGTSFLNTAALTGESVPRRVTVGENIYSGSVNTDAALRIKVTKEYEDSTVARILDLVENAGSRKARLENFITRFAGYYTPAVTIGAALLAFIPPFFTDIPLAESVKRACNFLIVSCPCAIVISVPLGFFAGIGAASKMGVLVKGSNFLEAAAGLTTMVMDKTGTLTKGEFSVTELLPAKAGSGSDEKESKAKLLELAAYGEGFSTHPIALSIKTAYGTPVDVSRLSDASEEAGHGTRVYYDGKELLVGNEKLMKEHGIDISCVELSGQVDMTGAKTFVYIAYDREFVGIAAISDVIKEGAKEAISEMKMLGIRNTVVLTGDRKKAADAIGQELGVDTVISELLPEDKVANVERLIGEQDGKGKLGFVGDGLNDAPVLMRADVGFAMGSLGSDAAIEAADIVIMDDDIRKIPAVIKIARRTAKTVRTNVVFAIGVKFLILFLSFFGMASVWAAVFGDVGVAVICILNSMLLGYISDGEVKARNN